MKEQRISKSTVHCVTMDISEVKMNQTRSLFVNKVIHPLIDAESSKVESKMLQTLSVSFVLELTIWQVQVPAQPSLTPLLPTVADSPITQKENVKFVITLS